jgi:hypothetical protein
MAILMILDIPGGTVEQYDKVNEAMGVDADNTPEGLISHVTGPTDDGLLIVDVWESEEALNRFVGERVMPAMQQVGVPEAMPRVMPVHNRIDTGAGTQPNVILLIESDVFTPDMYDQIVARMPAHGGDGSSHPSVSHVAGADGNGMVFVDVWDSGESAQRFFETQLGPASEGIDMGPIEPKVVPVHNRFAPAR